MGKKLSVDEMLAEAKTREDKIFLIQVIGQRDIKRLVKTVKAMLAADNLNRRM